MTYCTGSSSRDLFNYWDGEGWGHPACWQRGAGPQRPLPTGGTAGPARGLGPRLTPTPLPAE